MPTKKVLLEQAVQAARDAYNAAVAGLGVGATLDPQDTDGAVSGKAVGDYAFPKRQPFDQSAKLTNFEHWYDAIKKVELINADPAETYHISWIDRNYAGTNQTWQIRIVDSNGDGACTFVTTDYTEPNGIDKVSLSPAGGTDIIGYVWIDWTQIPDGARQNTVNLSDSILSPEVYLSPLTRDSAEGLIHLRQPFAHNDNWISSLEVLNIYEAIGDIRLYTNEVGEDYYLYRFHYRGGGTPDGLRIGIKRVSDDSVVAFSTYSSLQFSDYRTIRVEDYQGDGIYADIEIDGSILNPISEGPQGKEFKLSKETHKPNNRLKDTTKGLVVHHFEGTRSDALRIISKYDESRDFVLDFDEYGYNTMYGFASMKLQDNDKPYPDIYEGGAITNINANINSDWIGPHIVSAQNNPLNTYDSTFTGGNHNFREEGETAQTGEPTAREDAIEFFVDGEKTEKGKVYTADRVDIYIENAVTGFNTMQQDGVQGAGGSGRPIITERIHYTIRPKFGGGIAVEVMVEIEALEDINYYAYYGLQTMYGFHNGTVHFTHGSAESREDLSGNGMQTRVVSGDPSLYPDVDRVNLRSVDDNDDLICWLDRSFGLGDLSLNTSDDRSAWCANDVDKSYWGLIFDKDDTGVLQSYSEGDRIAWRGGYIFQPNGEQGQDTDLTSVFPKGNSISAYADFLAAGERDMPVPRNLQFKKVTEVDKSNSITIADTITPSGLNYVSTGYGVSEVEIK